MKTTLHLSFLFLFLSLFRIDALAQSSRGNAIEGGTFVIIKMIDGTKIVGKKLASTPESIIVETQLAGKLNLFYDKIERIRSISDPNYTGGRFWKQNSNYSRNVIGPSGYGLQKGEGYYQNVMLFLHNVSYGFTDNFSMSFGTELVSLLNTNDFVANRTPGFVISPKFTFPITGNNINIGVGGIAGHAPDSENIFDLGLVYGVTTFGSRDNNFSVGVGFGVVDGDFTSAPTFSLAGNFRVGNSVSITTENWFFPSTDVGLVTLGVRIIGEVVSWDFSYIGVFDNTFFSASPIPFVGIAVPFGRR